MAEVQEEQAAVRELAVFAGLWHAEGDVHAQGGKAASRWKSHERYEWLPGERFMANRWDADVGGHPFQGLAVLGHDEARGYFAGFFDNGGHAPTYRVAVDGRRWTFTGEAQRATYEFAADGRSMKIHWDVKGRDGAWQPLCDLRARRERSPAEVVEAMFAAFEAGDRAAAEALLDDDFRFSSPRDDRIDKAAFFARCWPNHEKIRAFRIERIFGHDDGEVVVRYSAERVAEGRLRETTVYFGRDLA